MYLWVMVLTAWKASWPLGPALGTPPAPVLSLFLSLFLLPPFSSSLLSAWGNFSRRTDERHDEGSSPCRSGTKERPSAGNVAPASSAKVGVKSVFRVSFSVFTPAATAGPRTKRGTRAPSSYGRFFPERTRCSPPNQPLSEVKKM